MTYLPLAYRICDEVYDGHMLMMFKLFDEKEGLYHAHCLICDKDWTMDERDLETLVKEYRERKRKRNDSRGKT